MVLLEGGECSDLLPLISQRHSPERSDACLCFLRRCGRRGERRRGSVCVCVCVCVKSHPIGPQIERVPSDLPFILKRPGQRRSREGKKSNPSLFIMMTVCFKINFKPRFSQTNYIFRLLMQRPRLSSNFNTVFFFDRQP